MQQNAPQGSNHTNQMNQIKTKPMLEEPSIYKMDEIENVPIDDEEDELDL